MHSMGLRILWNVLRNLGITHVHVPDQSLHIRPSVDTIHTHVLYNYVYTCIDVYVCMLTALFLTTLH